MKGTFVIKKEWIEEQSKGWDISKEESLGLLRDYEVCIQEEKQRLIIQDDEQTVYKVFIRPFYWSLLTTPEIKPTIEELLGMIGQQIVWNERKYIEDAIKQGD